MIRAALILLLAAWMAWPIAAKASSPEEAVAARVITAAAAGAPSAERVVPRNFNIPAICAFVLGPFWASASRDEQRDFSDLLTQNIAKALTRRPLATGDDVYSVVGVRKLANGDTVVLSRLKLARGEIANLDWRLRGSPPLIVDVSIDGRSTSVSRRNDYLARMHANGGSLRALVTALRSGAGHDP
jgi:ABC-type transporter MlaC component